MIALSGGLMSFIVAVISSRAGVVASDGRRFASVQIGQPAPVETNEWDKTFELSGEGIIGAFCGLLEFSGLTISEHIREIIASTLACQTRLTSIVDHITTGMVSRLNQAAEEDVARTERLVDVLLVGGERLKRDRKLKIFSIRFEPKEGTVIPEVRDWPMFCVAGDPSAMAAAKSFLDKNYVGNRGPAHLRKLAEQAVETAVAGTGSRPHTCTAACGGTKFFRSIFDVVPRGAPNPVSL